MWKLKIAEGGNDPYLYSTNNYVGRQTWSLTLLPEHLKNVPRLRLPASVSTEIAIM
ncbi:unnamed protein product [Rhodiola kirilowii]